MYITLISGQVLCCSLWYSNQRRCDRVKVTNCGAGYYIILGNDFEQGYRCDFEFSPIHFWWDIPNKNIAIKLTFSLGESLSCSVAIFTRYVPPNLMGLVSKITLKSPSHYNSTLHQIKLWSFDPVKLPLQLHKLIERLILHDHESAILRRSCIVIDRITWCWQKYIFSSNSQFFVIVVYKHWLLFILTQIVPWL